MEGPSIVIFKEELARFLGQKVLKVDGNTSEPKELLKNLFLKQIRSWGKNTFLTFSPANKKSKQTAVVVKVHFLMFGSYRINDPKENRKPRLQLTFKNGVVYLYSGSIKFNAEHYWDEFDKEVDLMSPTWNRDHVVSLMKKRANSGLCDIFLDQKLFAGSGNIIKNEVLFNIRRHPLTKLKQIDKSAWPLLADAVKSYCFDFYRWKKKFELRRHWQVYRQSRCPICNTKLIRENLGVFPRRSFFCPVCQNLNPQKKKLRVFEPLPPKTKATKEKSLDH